MTQGDLIKLKFNYKFVWPKLNTVILIEEMNKMSTLFSSFVSSLIANNSLLKLRQSLKAGQLDKLVSCWRSDSLIAD